MKRGILLGFVIAVLLIVNVSAGVYISGIKPVYNIGDFIDLNITVDPVVDSPLNIKLVCSGSSKDIFNGPAIDGFSFPLNSNWIGSLNGDCYIESNYNGESKKINPNFKISNQLTVSLNVDSFFVKPGEEIIVRGNVKRLSGENSNGEVEIIAGFLLSTTITNTNQTDNTTQTSTGSSFSGKVNEGEFSIALAVPDNIAAGDYKLEVNSYEKSITGDKINLGSSSASLKVSQVLTSMDIALDNQNYNPGDSLIIKTNLFDQTKSSMKDQISVVIVDEETNRVFEKVVQSDENVEYKIPTNLSGGYYIIKVSAQELNVTKSFFVNEKAIANFELINTTLIVTNIGNIPYNKSIQIEINGKPFVKQMKLRLGESKEFKLTGPDKSSLKVSDGDRELKLDDVSLGGGSVGGITGAAVGVSESGSSVSFSWLKPLFWVFILLVLIAAAFILIRFVRKKRSVAYPHEPRPLKLDKVIRKENERPVIEEKKENIVKASTFFSKTLIAPKEAQQALISRGSRNRVGIIAIKIKNKISTESKENLERALQNIYVGKGAICEQGEFIIGIFSPIVTRTFNNEIEAVKAGEKIANELREHNRKYSEKIAFGIGISSGDIINEIGEGKLKFTAMGNTLLVAKKLADASDEQLLLTREAHEKTMNLIKDEKTRINDIECYEVKKIVDYEKSKKFIDDFLKRQDKDKPAAKPYWNKDQ